MSMVRIISQMRSGDFLLLVLQFFVVPSLHGQEDEDVPAHDHGTKGSHHSISLMIGHTHIPKGVNGINRDEALIIPSWGLNYDFHLNEKWAIGWHNDMEISTYVIEEADGDVYERERPIITAIVGIFKPGKKVGLLAGFGREFEKHRNFWVFRAGVEVEIEINESWELIPSFIYDQKEAVYYSWAIGLAVARRF
jgi:hypothetical protein